MGIFNDRRHTSPLSHVRQALLEEALAPLAAFADLYTEQADEDPLLIVDVPYGDTTPRPFKLLSLTVGDARRAAKLLEPTS